MQLVSYTFKLDIVDKLMLKKEFHSLSRVAALPLFYRLTFPPDFSLLPDVRQAVLDHLKEAQYKRVRLLVAEAGLVFTQLSQLSKAFRLVWSAAKPWTIAWSILLGVQGLLPRGHGLPEQAAGRQPGRDGWRAGRLGARAPDADPGWHDGRRDGAGGGAARRGRVGSHRAVRAGADHISALIRQVGRGGPGVLRDARVSRSPVPGPRRGRHPAAALIESLGSLVQNGITIVAMAGVLLPYGLWLPLALFASTLPALAVVARHTLRNYQWSKQTTLERRRTWYYDWALTGGEFAAELRLFGLGQHFSAAYQSLHWRAGRLRLIRDQALARLGASLVALAISASRWPGWSGARCRVW